MTAPTAEHLEDIIGGLGIGNDHTVVLYDRRDSMWAARMWWLLRAFGHDRGGRPRRRLASVAGRRAPVCHLPCGYPPALSSSPTPEARPAG